MGSFLKFSMSESSSWIFDCIYKLKKFCNPTPPSVDISSWVVRFPAESKLVNTPFDWVNDFASYKENKMCL